MLGKTLPMMDEIRLALEAERVTDSERAMIDGLLQAEQRSNETDASDLPLAVTDWLDKELAHAAEAATRARSAADLGVEPLNELLRELVADGSV